MSDTALQTQEQATEQTSMSLLEQAISATKQTERSQAELLLKTLTEQALSGTVTWDKNLTKTIKSAIKALDDKVSKQLATIMHAPEVQKLEGSWRGLQYLVKNSLCSSTLKIRVMNLGKNELYKDLDKAIEFDQSEMFKKLYEYEYGTPGGEPYGVLLGDYEFTNHPQDLELLTNMSGVAAAAFCPFISAADPGMLGLEQWSDLAKPRDLEKIFDSVEYAKWRGFRDTEDARYTTLVMPRVLARLPYGKNTQAIEAFDFEEVELIEGSNMAKPVEHTDYCWMNAAYVLGARLTNAFAQYGWCTAIRGAEGGGKVEGLPTHIFMSDDGDPDMKCPTEIGITDRREAELSKMGFLPLCHYKNTDYAVFFGAQTAQKSKLYDSHAATANAAISARLPYLLASSRFAHYLKVLARDKVGSFMEAADAEKWLNNWIGQYVNASPDSGQDMKAKYPLAEAKVEVKEIPGKPGSYNAVAWLRPWLQLEELSTSLRLVARIPQLG
ncbi:MAG: type secretion protein EvpB/VC family [Gammaproteobacteria bacterium]|jgi:type VI secretion system protein ImpC|nr:type secretion protein EvpB/VC family [Gammaproteobacteria bacterium]